MLLIGSTEESVDLEGEKDEVTLAIYDGMKIIIFLAHLLLYYRLNHLDK